jgi:hypothetical protein
VYCNKFGIEIYQNGSGTTDDYGNFVPGEPLVVKDNISCDMQPYSTEKLQRDYGFNIEVTKRIFMDLDNNIVDLVENQRKTLYLKDGDLNYEMRKIVAWDNYMEVMIYDI